MMLIDRQRFITAPCYLCGYRGAGYFQPESHICAMLYHAGNAPELLAHLPGHEQIGAPSNVSYLLRRLAEERVALLASASALRSAVADLATAFGQPMPPRDEDPTPEASVVRYAAAKWRQLRDEIARLRSDPL